MEGIITLIIIYIIFSIFSSLVKKSQTGAKKTPPPRKKAPSKDAQATVEEYVGKLEKYLTQAQRSKQQVSKPKPKKTTPSSRKRYKPLAQQAKQEETPAQQVFASTDAELELSLSPPPLPEAQPPRELVLSEAQLTFPKEPETRRESSLLSFNKPGGYIRGVIMSEILRPPVSKRRNRKM